MSGDDDRWQRVLGGGRSIAVVAAVEVEASDLVKTWDLRGRAPYFEGSVSGRSVTLTLTGVGGLRALAAMERWVLPRRPSALLSVGFAGALAADLAEGQTVEPLGVSHVEGGRALRLDGPCPSPTEAAAELLSVDQLAATPEAKHALHRRSGARLVDMETHALAECCLRHRLPMYSVRVISDDARSTLPPESADWVREDGTIDTRAAAAYVTLRPWSMPRLLAMQRSAQRNARTLGQRLTQLLGA